MTFNLILLVQGVSALINKGFLDATIQSVILAVSGLAIAMALVFLALSIAWNYALTAVKRLKDQTASFFVDIEELIRVGIVIGCIILYMPLMSLVILFAQSASSTINPGDQVRKNMKDMTDKIHKAFILRTTYGEVADLLAVAKDPNNPQNSKAQSTLLEKYHVNYTVPTALEDYAASQNNKDNNSTITSTNSSSTNTTSQKQEDKKEDGDHSFLVWLIITNLSKCLEWLALLLGKLMRFIMLIFVEGYVKVLLCLGPLAFAFSIIPAFKNQINIWAGALLNALFCFLTINILDSITYGMLTDVSDYLSSDNSITHQWDSCCLSITMMVLYLSVFKLTAKYVGQAEVGSIIGKAMALAAVAAGAALMGGGAAGGGATSGNTTGVHVASALKEGFGQHGES